MLRAVAPATRKLSIPEFITVRRCGRRVWGLAPGRSRARDGPFRLRDSHAGTARCPLDQCSCIQAVKCLRGVGMVLVLFPCRDGPSNGVGIAMSAWLQDLRYSLKVLHKRPMYSVVTVLVFAIAIGANATVF